MWCVQSIEWSDKPASKAEGGWWEATSELTCCCQQHIATGTRTLPPLQQVPAAGAINSMKLTKQRDNSQHWRADLLRRSSILLQVF
jgi:hypothetical protein